MLCLRGYPLPSQSFQSWSFIGMWVDNLTLGYYFIDKDIEALGEILKNTGVEAFFFLSINLGYHECNESAWVVWYHNYSSVETSILCFGTMLTCFTLWSCLSYTGSINK